MNKNIITDNNTARTARFLKNKTFFNKNKDIIYCTVIVFLTTVIIGLAFMPEKNAEKITYNTVSSDVLLSSRAVAGESESSDTLHTSDEQPSSGDSVNEDAILANSFSETGTSGMMMLINEETYNYGEPSVTEPSVSPSVLPGSSVAPQKTPSATSASSSGKNTSSKIKEGEPKININTAGEAQLSRLPGVGEATAKKIIAYRQEKGRFNNIKDIMKVSGIGDKKFQNMQQFITVD